jgi:hypothetical protein
MLKYASIPLLKSITAMSGPGRPTLYKPERASRACMLWLRNRRPEEWRAKAETTPCAMQSIEREPTLWVRQWSAPQK